MEYAMPILSILNFNGNGIDDGRSKWLPISKVHCNNLMLFVWFGQCKSNCKNKDSYHRKLPLLLVCDHCKYVHRFRYYSASITKIGKLTILNNMQDLISISRWKVTKPLASQHIRQLTKRFWTFGKFVNWDFQDPLKSNINANQIQGFIRFLHTFYLSLKLPVVC